MKIQKSWRRYLSVGVVALSISASLYSLPGHVHAKALGTPSTFCGLDCKQGKENQARDAAEAAATKAQATYTAGCQAYIDNNGGHGTSVYKDADTGCKTTCSTGYHLDSVNACVINTPTGSFKTTLTGVYASGLTPQQLQAIVALLQAFGTDSSVVSHVKDLLTQN